jgi:hypothetical protein
MATPYRLKMRSESPIARLVANDVDERLETSLTAWDEHRQARISRSCGQFRDQEGIDVWARFRGIYANVQRIEP